MAKELNEDSGFKVSIKTLVGIGFAMATVISMWFMLQADIEEAKLLPVPPDPEVTKMEFQMKDENIRLSIKNTEEDVSEIKEDIKRIEDKIDALKVGEEGLNILATKIVSRMVKLKAMEEWFTHVSKSNLSWATTYEDLDLSEEYNALGEAAKLMTLLNLYQEDEAYEKCAIIKNRMDEVNKVLKKYNK